MPVLQWLHGVPGTGEQRGWVLPGTWMGAVWGVVLVRVKKEAVPLVVVLFGGDGVRQGCLVSLVCCEHGHDVCVGCGGRRGQDMVGVGASASRGGGDVKKRAPSCVYRRREGQVRAVGSACVTVPAWCTWHGGTAWLGVARHVDGCCVGCCVW